MDKIEDVYLREALREIAERNTFSHLDNDINITFDQIERAMKLVNPAEKTLIFIAYPSGIDSYPECEVFLKDTRGYNGVMFHGFDMQRDLKLSYAVEITSVEDGAARGNIFEIDIRKYAEKVRAGAVVSDTIRLYLSDPRDNGGETIMPKAEFDRRYPLDLPKMSHYRHEPADPAALLALLDKARTDRETNSEPRSLWAHTSDLYDNRFTFYADQIVRDLNKLPEANSQDKRSFSVPLNSIIANYFNPEQYGRLMDAMPYKNVSFAIHKGGRDLRVIVPRDEILQLRREPAEKSDKPSILEAIKQGAEKSKQQSGHKPEPKKSKGMEI